MIDTYCNLPYQLSNYNSAKVLDMDLMCPIVIKIAKTKIKNNVT